MSLLLYSILLLIAANLTNVHVDAYKIQFLNKTIRHSINFAVYAGVVVVCALLTGYQGAGLIWFAILAFSCRQLFFDIPLNWRRGLRWNYVTTADPPGAIMDRIEIYLFGRDGKTPVYIYAGLFVVTTVILLSI